MTVKGETGIDTVGQSFVIDLRRRKESRLYIRFWLLFWVVWTAATICITWSAITHFSFLFALWLFFGYTGILLIPLPLLNTRGKEIITARPDGLEVNYLGFLWKKVFLARDQLELVSLEKYAVEPGSADKTGAEAIWTLNLIGKSRGRTKRIVVAALATVEEKEEIYARLVQFLKANGFDFRQRNSFFEEKGVR